MFRNWSLSASNGKISNLLATLNLAFKLMKTLVIISLRNSKNLCCCSFYKKYTFLNLQECLYTVKMYDYTSPCSLQSQWDSSLTVVAKYLTCTSGWIIKWKLRFWLCRLNEWKQQVLLPHNVWRIRICVSHLEAIITLYNLIKLSHLCHTIVFKC